MKIRALNSDGEFRRLENPTIDDVKNAIQSLNGETCTIVTLEVDEDWHMGIGGGKNGRCVVYMTADNLRFKNLKNLPPDERLMRIDCGGQEGEFRADQMVSKDVALRAAVRFAERGDANPDLNWSDE